MADKKDKPTHRQDNPPEYEPPRATRLSDMQAGSGTASCTAPGSGNAAGCTTGNTAPTCSGSGNTATTNCISFGNDD